MHKVSGDENYAMKREETMKVLTASHGNQQVHNTINGRSIVDTVMNTSYSLPESIDHFIFDR